VPLWYVGAGPLFPEDVNTNDYTKSLVSRNLSQATVDSTINTRFSPFGLVSYLTGKRDNASESISLARQSFVDAGNENKILLSSIVDPITNLPTGRPTDATTQALKGDDAVAASRSGGTAVILDSAGKVPKSRISVTSSQRWLAGYWSPSSYISGPATGETALCNIPVNPYITGNYRIIVTGSVSAKAGVDGQYPIIQVRASNGTSPYIGSIIATGYGPSESHKGGLLSYGVFPGTQSYSIPSWCNKIDVVAIGGGGGGVNGGSLGFDGGGGDAGDWRSTTLIRGTSGSATLPISTTTLSYTIGAGANNANFNLFGDSGSPGGSTTCSGTGMTTLTAPGGKTGGKTGQTVNGEAAGDYTFNGLTYVGGLAAIDQDGSPAIPGKSPGGGGQGGRGGLFTGNPGARGADGAIFFYAYLAEDESYGQITVMPSPLSSAPSTIFNGPVTVYVNVLSSGTSAVATSSLSPQISVMVVPV